MQGSRRSTRPARDMTIRSSEHLRDAAPSIETDYISLARLIQLCGIGSGGLLLALLGALCVLPIPGVGTVLGTGIAGLALTLWKSGVNAPLSERIVRFEMSPAWARRVFHTLSTLRSIESRFVRARWPRLVCLIGRRRTAILVGVLGVLIALPIPFGNLFPALALICLGIGLRSRDGVALIVGLAMSFLGLALPMALTLAAWHLGSGWLAPFLPS